MLSNMMYKLYQLTVSGRGSVCSSMYMHIDRTACSVQTTDNVH